VAAKAGVSQGTIYHYFSDKEALFLAAYETWEVQSLYGEIQQALDVSKSPTEQLQILAQTVAQRMTQAAAMLPANVEFWSHLARNEAVRQGFQHLFAAMREGLADIIRGGVARGEFVETPPEEIATLLIAVYDGLVLQWLADPQSVNWPTISQTLTRVLLHGLLNPAENPATQGDPHV